MPVTQIGKYLLRETNTIIDGAETMNTNSYKHFNVMNGKHDEISFTGSGSLTGHIRSRKYTKPFRFTQKLQFNFEYPMGRIPSKLREKPLFTPENIIFVTDGSCGSACASLTKWAKERKLARVFGIGAILDDPYHVGYDIATSACARVHKFSEIAQASKFLRSKYKLPSAFPRSGTDVTFIAQMVYSADIDLDTRIGEFNVVQPDAVLRVFPNALPTDQREIMSTFAARVKGYFDSCFPGEVSSNSSCNGP